MVGCQRIRKDINSLFIIRVVIDSDCHSRFVARIVADKCRDITVRVCNRIGSVKRNGIRIGARRCFRVFYAAVQRQDCNIRKIVIIACGNAQRAAGKRCGRDFRRGIVDSEIKADIRAFAERIVQKKRIETAGVENTGIRIGKAVVQYHAVVFGNCIVSDAERIVLRKTV